MPHATLDEKYDRLQEILRELGSLAVAFSAGVDSTLLLKVAVDTLGSGNVIAVTGRSDSLAKADFEQACSLAATIGAEHVVIDTDEFDNPDYVSNPSNRCYFCKRNLYGHIQRLAAARGLNSIVCGTNVDDFNDFRPGIEAANVHGVRSPIAEAGLTKDELRQLSKRLDLPTHDQPASPCLASRIPYGQEVTPEKLRMIDAAETFLHELGIRECRVRHHDGLARIEVSPELIPDLAQPENTKRIHEHFHSLGFAYVTLDLRGFRSGSLNEVITINTGTSAPP